MEKDSCIRVETSSEKTEQKSGCLRFKPVITLYEYKSMSYFFLTILHFKKCRIEVYKLIKTLKILIHLMINFNYGERVTQHVTSIIFKNSSWNTPLPLAVKETLKRRTKCLAFCSVFSNLSLPKPLLNYSA